MIEANINEYFPISVSLVDEASAQLVTGQVVTYDIRTFDDVILSPPVSGTLVESEIEGGIYKAEISLPEAGVYTCYATCSGFFSGSEDIVISSESYTDIAKYSLPHNISVIDVPRTSTSGTASQTIRNVAIGNTDYIVTIVKRDTDINWNNPVASGVNYAWYDSMEANLPYMMGAEY